MKANFSYDSDTGKITEDASFDSHVGRCILKKLKEEENEIHQIEIINGTSETCGSFRLRTIRMAQSLRRLGLNVGDVVLICGVNHNNLSVPFIACQYLGLTPIGMASGLTKAEVEHFVPLAKPNLIFSDPDMVQKIEDVLLKRGIQANIITFDEVPGYMNFSDFVNDTGDEEDFRCTDIDTNTTICFVVSSSGTTGLPKLVRVTHRAAFYTVMLPNMEGLKLKRGDAYLYFTPLCWITSVGIILSSCIIGFTRVQSKKPYSFEILKDAMAKYKPTTLLISAFSVLSITKIPKEEMPDFPSVKLFITGGSALPCEILDNFKKHLPNARFCYVYGMGEIGYVSINDKITKNVTVGNIYKWVQWKIVDVNTKKVVGDNQLGELYLKSVTMFKEYINDPETTREVFDEDGFYKTGDLVYCDENGLIYVVDRIKEMIKCRSHQVSPAELENLIATLPEVNIVAVLGKKDEENIESPVAFVKLVKGSNVTAQQIKDLVSGTLSDYKALRGGVVFTDHMPMTPTGKVDRATLKTLIHTVKPE